MRPLVRTALCVWCGFTARCYFHQLGMLCRNCWQDVSGEDPEAGEW